eukprot:5250400-Prymnesium_polylepis.2
MMTIRWLAVAVPVAATANSVVHDARYDRTQFYDALYARGYHRILNYSQTQILFPTIRELLSEGWALQSALDVGCSHGLAVTRLWELGLRASGVDLSHAAIETARRVRPDEQRRCVVPNAGHNLSCFQQGSAAELPWPNRSFDLTVSSDVLEHVPLELADLAIAELSRVTRTAMVLKISVRREGLTPEIRKMLKDVESDFRVNNQSIPRVLHETRAHSAWWITRFNRHGFELNRSIPTPGHLCCAFVLRRHSRLTTRKYVTP